jgi:hypothetical protein
MTVIDQVVLEECKSGILRGMKKRKASKKALAAAQTLLEGSAGDMVVSTLFTFTALQTKDPRFKQLADRLAIHVVQKTIGDLIPSIEEHCIG